MTELDQDTKKKIDEAVAMAKTLEDKKKVKEMIGMDEAKKSYFHSKGYDKSMIA